MTPDEEKGRVFDKLHSPDRPIYHMGHARRANSADEYNSEDMRATAKRLLAQRRQQRFEMSWQLIDTAPKDGTTIRVKLPETDVRVFWCSDLKSWVLCSPIHMETVRDPTHWLAEV